MNSTDPRAMADMPTETILDSASETYGIEADQGAKRSWQHSLQSFLNASRDPRTTSPWELRKADVPSGCATVPAGGGALRIQAGWPPGKGVTA